MASNKPQTKGETMNERIENTSDSLMKAAKALAAISNQRRNSDSSEWVSYAATARIADRLERIVTVLDDNDPSQLYDAMLAIEQLGSATAWLRDSVDKRRHEIVAQSFS